MTAFRGSLNNYVDKVFLNRYIRHHQITFKGAFSDFFFSFSNLGKKGMELHHAPVQVMGVALILSSIDGFSNGCPFVSYYNRNVY